MEQVHYDSGHYEASDGMMSGQAAGGAGHGRNISWADESGYPLYEVYYSDKLHYSSAYEEEASGGGGCCVVS